MSQSVVSSVSLLCACCPQGRRDCVWPDQQRGANEITQYVMLVMQCIVHCLSTGLLPNITCQ